MLDLETKNRKNFNERIKEKDIEKILIHFNRWLEKAAKKNSKKRNHQFSFTALITNNEVYISFGKTKIMYNGNCEIDLNSFIEQFNFYRKAVIDCLGLANEFVFTNRIQLEIKETNSLAKDYVFYMN